MKCSKCEKLIVGSMKFCPYCGIEIGGTKGVENTDLCKEIGDFYAKDQYKEIFDRAVQGNNVAKCYFVTYLYITSKKSTDSDENLKKQISELAEQGEVFAISSRGISLFYDGKKQILGVENDRIINEGVKLIKQASDAGEAAAMTFVAEWMFNGSYAEKNISAAYAMMKSASDIGYPPAMYKLSEWHRYGTNGISKNEELANDLLEKAAFFGDQDAMAYFRKNHMYWFKAELEYAIPKESIKNISEVVCECTNETYLPDKLPFQNEYDSCNKKEEYIALYKKIRNVPNKDRETRRVFNLLELLVSKITGLTIVGTTLEEAEEEAKIAGEKSEKINNLINMYECPQHYLHFLDDIKRLNIGVDQSLIPELLDVVSISLQEKCQKEFSSYANYRKVKKDAEDAKSTGCVVIGLLVLAVIVGIFFLPVGIGIGIFVLLGELKMIKEKNKFKKISPKIKDDYLLINSLIGYGYKPVDPTVIEVKFDTKEPPYVNNVPSVLDNISL